MPTKTDPRREALERQTARVKALEEQAAHDYFMLCNAQGITIEDLPLYEVGRLEEQLIQREDPEAIFLREADKRIKCGVGDVFREAGKKRRLLRLVGYAHLNGPEGKRIPLEECSDAKIGEAFRKTYRALTKK